MPISGPSSFVPTLNEFIGHWTDVNLILAGAGPLVLQDGTTIAILTGYRDQLQAFGSSIQGKLNDLQIADADVNQKARWERLSLRSPGAPGAGARVIPT